MFQDEDFQRLAGEEDDDDEEEDDDSDDDSEDHINDDFLDMPINFEQEVIKAKQEAAYSNKFE